MIFSKVRCTTKREKCQSFLCRSALGNYSILGLCFHLESSIKWANRYDACGEGREACYDEKVTRPTLPNNTESAIVKKIHLMNVLFFCLELGGTAMTMGGSRHSHEKWAAVLGDNQRGQSHLTWPLVHRKRPRTLSCINVCFIHLMDVVLMDFFLLMHYQ